MYKADKADWLDGKWSHMHLAEGDERRGELRDGDMKLMKDAVPRARRAADVLSTILDNAGVNAGSAVRVTGKGGLAPLIWLCRRGFDDVAYVHYHGGGPRDPADVLLILQSTPPAELEHWPTPIYVGAIAAAARIGSSPILIARGASVAGSRPCFGVWMTVVAIRDRCSCRRPSASAARTTVTASGVRRALRRRRRIRRARR